jgi:hypothetical protein
MERFKGGKWVFSAMNQPVRPVVGTLMMLLLLGTVTGVVVAYWNGADQWLQKRRTTSPFDELVLMSVRLETDNVRREGVRMVPTFAAPISDREFTPPPVKYLPLLHDPIPPYRVPAILSESFVGAISERISNLLEQGKVPVEENPKALRGDIGAAVRNSRANGFLTYRVIPEIEKDGTVTCRIIGELSRTVYITRDSPTPILLPILRRTEGPFRVKKEDLEAALAYELEKMLIRDIIMPYQTANRIPTK